MKTNFLCRNVLPRGSCVFLKMVVTVTALLCFQLIVYGQPVQTNPVDGNNNFPLPGILEWGGDLTEDIDIEIYEYSAPSSGTIDLGAYEYVCGPILIDNIPDDLSGVTYNSLTNELYMVQNGNPTVYRTSLSGDWQETIPLPGFEDTEGIVHIGGTQYAVAEERRGIITFFDIENVSYSNTVQLPDDPPNWSWGPNVGLEGVTYNPVGNGTVYTVKEKSPKGYYSFANPDPTSFPVTLNTVNTPCNITTDPFGFNDVAGMHHLGLNDLNLGVEDHVLLLSHESWAVVEADGCNEVSRLDLTTDGANGTLDHTINQPEGITMDNNGNLYIVGEKNELYVFAKPPNSNGTIYNAIASGGQHTVASNVLVEGQQYYWRIKYSDECAWSSTWSFTAVNACLGNTTTQACDDGNPCTENDTETIAADGSICESCAGTLTSCDNSDCTTQVPCDDGDVWTSDDVEIVAADGSICIPCTGTSICIALPEAVQTGPCEDNDPCTISEWSYIQVGEQFIECEPCSVIMTITEGDACDDGDANTENDTVQADCSCVGTPIIMGCTDPDACNFDASATQDDGFCIYATGCDVCDGNGGVTDNPESGEPCDDGIACTENDTVQADCSCVGTSQDADNDSVCDVEDVCPGFDDTLIGTACDDGNDCTVNDVYTSDCECIGVLVAPYPTFEGYNIVFIESVELNGQTINNSGDDSGYGDYTANVLATLNSTSTVTLTPGSNFANIGFLQNWGVWIDVDKNGIFDNNELVYTGTSVDEMTPVTGTFNVPSGTGTTTMRVVMVWDDTPGLCGQFAAGEVEDYTVALSPCPDQINVIQSYVSGSYEATDIIFTDQSNDVLVDVSEQLTLDAGYSVTLNPGFTAACGSTMRAYIDGCESPTNPKVEQSSTFASVKPYPNPFKNEVALEFSLEADAEAQIVISDVNGKTITQLPAEQLYRGTQTIDISTKSWIPGIYFYQVQIREQNTGILSHASGTLVKM